MAPKTDVFKNNVYHNCEIGDLSCTHYLVEGPGGREPERKGGERKREKEGEITKHCAIFCNRKSAKRQGLTKNRVGTGIKGYGKQEV